MKIMKRIAAAVAAAVCCAAVACAAFAQGGAGDVSLGRIGGSLIYHGAAGTGADFLVKNRTVKSGALVVAKDETLVVPAGKKLVLQRGLEVFGQLYIEEGGYVAVSGGSADVCGTIVCDGTLAIGKNAAARISDRGTLFVNSCGTLKYRTEQALNVMSRADAVCLGTLDAPALDEASAAYLKSAPVCASVIDRDPDKNDVRRFTTDEGELSEIIGCTAAYGEFDGQDFERLSRVMFSSGAVIDLWQIDGLAYTAAGVNTYLLRGLCSEVFGSLV